MDMIKIVTDSASDIPQDLIREYGIIVVPTHIIWGDQQYLDGVTMTAEELYTRLPQDPVVPTSSQPTVSQFQAAFDQAVAEGADQIVSISVGAGFSGTFQAAKLAAENYKVPISLVDSRAVSLEEGWQVLAAARSAQAGETLQQILGVIEKVRQRVNLIVGMDSLTYVARSGRLGPAFKWIGNLIPVRPIVSVNAEICKIEPVTVVRTQKVMLEKVYQHFKQRMQGKTKLHVAIIYGGALDAAKKLAERLSEELKPVELLITSTGPVLGIHTGPGTVGISGYSE
jgi:DegV family protein with EDD domain